MSLQILLLEDSEADAEHVSDLFRSMDLGPEPSVSRARSLAQALELARERRFDLALVDLTLPDAEGMRVVEELVAATDQALPVVVLSGTTDESAAAEARQRGAQEFLSKTDVAADILFATIRHALQVGRMERTLRRERENLQLALSAAEAGTWILDVETLAMQRDERAAALLGFDAGQPGPFDLADCLSRVVGEDRERVSAAWAACIETGQDIEIVYRVRGPGREARYVSDRGRVVSTENGAPRIVSGISWDTTDRRIAEDALFSAQREESLSALAGGVAHDFNNLLVAILGHCALGQHEVGPDSVAGDHLRKAIVAAERAAALARQMLAYSGQGQFEVRAIDLNRAISENRAFLTAAVDHRIHIETRLDPDLPSVIGDANQLQQVVMNLMLNGADSCARGSLGRHVRITTRAHEIGNDGDADGAYYEFTRQPLEPGSYVSLSVRDDGGGIADDVRRRIFEPFFSTKGAGRGLGLSAVLGIVRGHGGGLAVRSWPGEGAEFEVLLPAAAGVEPPTPPTPATEDDALEDRRVLVIDDDPSVREACTAMLKLLGAEAILAPDGQAGIESFTAHRSSLDAVLLDMTMPGLSGAEVLGELRRIDQELPVVVASGYAEKEVLGKFGNELPDAFIQKPYRPQVLGRTLAEAIEGRAAKGPA